MNMFRTNHPLREHLANMRESLEIANAMTARRQRELEESAREVHSLHLQANLLEQKNDGLQTELKAEKERREERERDLAYRLAYIDKGKEYVENLKTEQTEAKETIQNLETRVSELGWEIEALEALRGVEAQETELLEQELADIEQDFTNLLEFSNELEDNYAKAAQDKFNLELYNQYIFEQATNSNAMVQNQQKEIETLGGLTRMLTEDIQALVAEKSMLEDSMEAKKYEDEVLKDALKEVNKNLADHRETTKKLRLGHNAEKDGFNFEIQRLNLENNRLRLLEQHKSNEYDALLKMYQVLQAEKSKLSAQVGRLNAAAQTDESLISAMADENKSIYKFNVELSTWVERLERRLDHHYSDTEWLNTGISSLVEECAEHASTIKTRGYQMARLRKRLGPVKDLVQACVTPLPEDEEEREERDGVLVEVVEDQLDEPEDGEGTELDSEKSHSEFGLIEVGTVRGEVRVEVGDEKFDNQEEGDSEDGDFGSEDGDFGSEVENVADEEMDTTIDETEDGFLAVEYISLADTHTAVEDQGIGFLADDDDNSGEEIVATGDDMDSGDGDI